MATDATGMRSGLKMESVQYKFRSYHFNGANRMRKWDGVAWYNSGISRAEFTPILAASGTGLTGTYKYYVVPINSKHFTPIGRPVQGLPSYLSAALSVNNQGIALSNIPATHADSQVDQWQIFRSKNLDYDFFFFVDTINIGTTTYTDTTTDDSLSGYTLTINQQIPATAKKAIIFGERMFSWGFDAYSTGTATKVSFTINNKEITSNVATMTTSATHSYSVGEFVTQNMTPPDPIFDGTFKITAVTGTTYSFLRVNANVVSAAATGTVQQILFSGSSIADGYVGCLFKKADNANQFTITQRNSSTNITLDKVMTDALSAASFKIYRNPWEVWGSEFQNPEACGPAGEFYRYKRELPGYDHVTTCIAHLGNLITYSATNIYVITGRSPNWEDIRITPDPIYKGLGCVSIDGAFAIENVVYFLSLQGPCVLEGNSPRLIGKSLGTDWLDSLTGAELAMAQVYGNNDFVWFSVPASGEAECSKTFRFDRARDTWWEERFAHPKGHFYDDSDGGHFATCYYYQNKDIIQPDYGTYDIASTSYSGGVTTGGTLTLDNIFAVFPTTGNGLAECYVHVFSAGVYQGSRRITSNTGTQLTWASSGVGGGSLTVSLGMTYEIGKPWWTWKTKTYQTPGVRTKIKKLALTFNEIDSAKSVKVSNYYDNMSSALSVEDNPQTQTLTELEKAFTPEAAATCYAVKLESRNLATVRHLIVDTQAEGTEQQ